MIKRVLIVDDEANIRRTMEMIHKNAGWETASAAGGDEALDLMEKESFDVVYLDLAMPGRDGIDVLREIKLKRPDQMVVILTGQGTIEKAVEATKLGAFDFLEKDCGKEKILLVSRNALEHRTLADENRLLKTKVMGKQEFVGRGRAVKEIFEQIARAAPTNARILIRGESGTGKELIAQAIHERSKRSDGPFVKVNCAAIPEELIEAELFGSEKGAYTGSVESRVGKFQAAHGGTLFLDEVGDMSLRVQTKVLRAIQEGEIARVGSDKTIQVDVRVIAATNKNLEKEIEAGSFREDLYFRLNVVPIAVPALREHPEDIPLLAEAFIKDYCEENGLPPKTLDDRVTDQLKRYPWPGNVRELRNQVERMVIMSSGKTIHIGDLTAELRQGTPTVAVPGFTPGADSTAGEPARGEAEPREGGVQAPPSTGELQTQAQDIQAGFVPDPGIRSFQEAKRRFERDLILQALERNDWNITQTAEELVIERTNLHKKIKSYGLTRNKE
ncbi:MAG: response regulator [Candidatus Latescibacteria bacterium]|nr:response regulator [Candidatus Latescibacterota bacterium]NIM64411.1 response regulator [Candidatus Latescibacterota bacterium]NIO00565.1 response regulator [Candidatus Latescibacterota bacterium]NIO26965.1 response regulator [Candidatus Latescibacterota bacterium]NIO56042.1 response regulator [Candidatus Latescibacterota bacterium]